jgi:hypothetical protein
MTDDQRRETIMWWMSDEGQTDFSQWLIDFAQRHLVVEGEGTLNK